MRTKAPNHYIAPTSEEIREAAQNIGLNDYCISLVNDLANIAAGGSINPPSVYASQIRAEEDKKMPPPDCDGEWQVQKGYTKNKIKALNERVNNKMCYHQRVCDFLQTLEMDRFPGDSPLEKAMSCLSMLSKMEGGRGDGEPLPIFQKGNGESVTKKLHEALETVTHLQKEEEELLNPNGELDRREIAEKIIINEELLAISRKLDEISKLRVKILKKYEADPEGTQIRNRGMRSLTEISKMAQVEWVNKSTYLLYRMVSGIAQVRERVRPIERKQLLFILVDCSGSMDNGKRIQKALGILLNRLKAVVSGDAEIIFSFFDSSLYTIEEAKTKEAAVQLLKKISKANFGGGGTDICGCIKTAHNIINEIMEKGEHHRPEIVVVTDGNDDVNLEAAAFIATSTKIHSFIVECRNEKLTDFCIATGGVGLNNL